MISKQQTRLMGFALLFAFAALRAMASEGNPQISLSELHQPAKTECATREIACMSTPPDSESKQLQQKKRLQKNQRIIQNRNVASAK